MKKHIIILIATFALIKGYAQENQFPNVNIPLESERDIPSGWILAGSNPRDYEIGQDTYDPYSGYFCAYLKSVVSRPQGYVTVMQVIKSDKFRGERISFSGYVKAKFVSNWAGLWMRIDDVIGRPLSFDNMSDRPIVGNSDWVKYEVVLDVPMNSSEISFGVLLDGRGQIWFDKLDIKAVEMGVPVTDRLKNKVQNTDPINLDFEE